MLWETFDHDHLFWQVPLLIYGKQEVVRIMAATLWRPIGKYLQFVWAVTSRGPIVLMCSDLATAPTLILELYCRRVRIEILFDTLKNVLGAFRFHFWRSVPAPPFPPPYNQRRPEATQARTPPTS